MQNSPARSTLDVGAVVAGTYEIEALIGRGGMGAVFLASHLRLPNKKVAIKVLHPEMTDDELVARFKREAEIASRLGHPNIVEVHDVNELPDGTPYIVMEYLEGETLARRLKNGPLSLDATLSIVRQIGSALAVAHREGIVHRDLKPQNVFLVPTELEGHTGEIAKVLDFGISKIRGSQTVVTQEAALLGTPQYMAPEQAKGEHALVDERTDVFALGAIVYEMLGGKPAFAGGSIPEVVFKVVYEEPAPLDVGAPATIVAAIARAMAKPADARFATVGAFAEALTGEPLALPRASGGHAVIDAGSPSSRARSTGAEAFAQTVGSERVRGSAPTVASHASVALSRRTRIAIAALAIGFAAAGGLALYFALRGGARDAEPQTQVTTVDKPKPPAVAPDAAAIVVAAPPDAAPPPEPPKPEPPKPAKPPKKLPATAAPEAKPDPHAKDSLDRAEAALRAGEWSNVERLANSVIDSEDGGATDYQREHARALRGIASCHLHNSQEGLQINLRGITRPNLKRRLLDGCRDANVSLPDQ